MPAFNGPIPPSLHWLLLILIHLFTFGLFGFIWFFVQSSWIRKINRNSKATGFFVLSILSLVASIAATSVVGASVAMDGGVVPGLNMMTALVVLGVLLLIVSPVLFYVGIFSMKKSLETYYNTIEPIGLRMSAGMVFFFHTLYFQYHFTRIAEWKRTGTLS
jgi:magnesium-transporting ATPase (P-type)